MNLSGLNIGDLLFIRNGKLDYIHCAVCTAKDEHGNVKITHTLGKMEPYSLAETYLPPKKTLQDNDIHYDVIRFSDLDKLMCAINTIKIWTNNLVPYDQDNYEKMLNVVSDKNVVGSEGSLKKYSLKEIKRLLKKELSVQRDLYFKNKKSLLIYSANKEIGPTLPYTLGKDTKVPGIICTTIIILPLQISFISQTINSCANNWVVEDNVFDNFPHKELKIMKVSDCITYPVEQFDYSAIPQGLRLDPNYCPVSILYDSLCKDPDNFINMGELLIPDNKNYAPFHNKFIADAKNLVINGNIVRSKLLQNITK